MNFNLFVSFIILSYSTMETNWNQCFFNFVEANMDKPWDWFGLSQNPNITWDIVEANPDKHWDWDKISGNKNITFDIVEANPDKHWDWKSLSKKKFTKEKENFELRVKHQKFVQEHLFEELVKIAMHPNKIEKYLSMGYTIDELDDIL